MTVMAAHLSLKMRRKIKINKTTHMKKVMMTMMVMMILMMIVIIVLVVVTSYGHGVSCCRSKLCNVDA